MASPVLSPSTNVGGDEAKKKQAQNGKRKKPISTMGDFGVNLMPAELKPFIGAPQKTFTHRLIVSVLWGGGLAAFIYAGIWGYGYYLSNNKLKPLSNELTVVNADISSLEAQRTELLAFQSSLSNAKTLLDKHKYWSQFLEALERFTITDVAYINVISSQDGSITMAGFAKDYRAVGRQLVAFQQATEVISSASISSANAVLNPNGEVIGVNFSLSLKLQPNVLKFKPITATPVAPTSTTPSEVSPIPPIQ